MKTSVSLRPSLPLFFSAHIPLCSPSSPPPPPLPPSSSLSLPLFLCGGVLKWTTITVSAEKKKTQIH